MHVKTSNLQIGYPLQDRNKNHQPGNVKYKHCSDRRPVNNLIHQADIQHLRLEIHNLYMFSRHKSKRKLRGLQGDKELHHNEFNSNSNSSPELEHMVIIHYTRKKRIYQIKINNGEDSSSLTKLQIGANKAFNNFPIPADSKMIKIPPTNNNLHIRLIVNP